MLVKDSELKINLMIQDMWAKGIDFIIDMRAVNIDADSYVHKTLEKILLAAE